MEETEHADFKIVGTTPADDEGAPLQTWLAILGGNLVDVAAMGHCGWLACYAALYNVADGLMEPSMSVVEAANVLKKQVINLMVATLDDEMRLNPLDLNVELEASGIRSLDNATRGERICALANHYVAQRQKSVKTAVPMHFWVRPAHIKAMAIHARETIYVLDVDEQGNARAQAYAYRSIALEEDDAFESGTNLIIPTQQAMQILEEMVAEGILPPVLVLRWRKTGNHFQAVTYDGDRYDCYIKHLKKLASVRNAVLVKNGLPELDFIQYDPESTAKAATRELKALRKATKAQKAETYPQDDVSEGDACRDESDTTAPLGAEAGKRHQGWRRESKQDIGAETVSDPGIESHQTNEGDMNASRVDQPKDEAEGDLHEHIGLQEEPGDGVNIDTSNGVIS